MKQLQGNIFFGEKINYHNLHMMAYPGSIRKLVENLLKAIREIKKLSRLKKKMPKIVNIFVIWEFQ